VISLRVPRAQLSERLDNDQQMPCVIAARALAAAATPEVLRSSRLTSVLLVLNSIPSGTTKRDLLTS
jgi:hypothetical protein